MQRVLSSLLPSDTKMPLRFRRVAGGGVGAVPISRISRSASYRLCFSSTEMPLAFLSESQLRLELARCYGRLPNPIKTGGGRHGGTRKACNRKSDAAADTVS